MALYSAIAERWEDDSPALLEPGGAIISFAQLCQRVDRLAAEIAAATRSSSNAAENAGSSPLVPRRNIAAGGPGDPAGLCAEPTPNSVIALLAILRSGRPYVPLDPSYPTVRLRYMAEDARICVLLCVGVDPAAAAAWFDGRVLEVPEAAGSDHGGPSTSTAPPPAMQSPDTTAYILYTSGSTGRPKGVIGSHRSMLRRLDASLSCYPFADNEVGCHKTSLNFVDSICEILLPLSAGVPLLLVPTSARSNPEELIDLLASYRVTRLTLVPSLLRAMLEVKGLGLGGVLPALQWWTVSGEALPIELANRFFSAAPHATLLNLYGSTEVAGDCTWAELTKGSSLLLPIIGEGQPSVVPIGVALPECKVELLDPHTLAVVEPGETGEIFVTGSFLADGYLRQAEASTASFPWLRKWYSILELGRSAYAKKTSADEGAERFFRSGDFGYRLGDESTPIYFVGRRDQQVKVRGQRVELLEVEAAMHEAAKSAGAAQVAVAAWGGGLPKARPGGGGLERPAPMGPPTTNAAGLERRPSQTELMRPPRLVGLERSAPRPSHLSTPRQEAASSSSSSAPDEAAPSEVRLVAFIAPEHADAASLLSHVAATLPAHMVPAIAYALPELPMLPNGKLDRQSLMLEPSDPNSSVQGRRPVFLNAPHDPLHAVAGTVTRQKLTPIQIAVRDLWAELLSLPTDSIHLIDRFHHLGGTSLGLVTLMARLRSEFGCAEAITVKALASAGDLAGVSALVERTRQFEISPPYQASPSVAAREQQSHAISAQFRVEEYNRGITRDPRAPRLSDVWRVSSMQSAVLFQHLLGINGGTSSTYLEQFVFPIVGRRPLQIDAFRGAWQAVLDKNEALRAQFDWQSGAAASDSEHLQPIACLLNLPWSSSRCYPPAAEDENESNDGGRPRSNSNEQDEATIRLEERSIQLVADYLEKDRKKGFDLSKPPLMRCHLTTIDERSDGTERLQHVLVLTIHHILFDGWSLGLLLQMVADEYSAALPRPLSAWSEVSDDDVNLPAAEKPPSYHDFIEWEAEQDRATARTYFKQLLGKVSAPSPFPRYTSTSPAAIRAAKGARTSASASTARTISFDVTALHAASSALECSLASAVHTAWSIVFSAFSGSKEVLYATTVSGRSAPLRHSDRVIGLMLNTLPVLVSVVPSSTSALSSVVPSFRTLLLAVHEQILSSLEHESCPLADILQNCVPPPPKSGETASGYSEGQLLWAMLDFEPEQPPIPLQPDRDEKPGVAGCTLMSPRVIDRIGFALSLRASHHTTQGRDGTKHILRLMATSEDERLGASFLERLLVAMKGCLQMAGRDVASANVMDLRKAADATVHEQRPPIAPICPPSSPARRPACCTSVRSRVVSIQQHAAASQSSTPPATCVCRMLSSRRRPAASPFRCSMLG